MKAIDEQISRTLEENGYIQSIQPNIAVEGLTVNETVHGVGFKISRTGSGISNTSITDGPNGTDSGEGSGSSIRLPKDALGNRNGEHIDGFRI